jgi:hypothetical protein
MGYNTASTFQGICGIAATENYWTLSTKGLGLSVSASALWFGSTSNDDLKLYRNNTERLRLTTTGIYVPDAISVGTTTALGRIYTVDETATPGRWYFDQYRSSSGVYSGATFRKARNTLASPTSVISGDTLGSVEFYGYDGTGFLPAASILALVDSTTGTNDMPTSLVFRTTADGAATTTERGKFTSAGIFGVVTGVSVGTSYYSTTPPSNGMIVQGLSGFGVSSVNSATQVQIAPGTNYHLYMAGTYAPVLAGFGAYDAVSCLPTFAPSSSSTDFSAYFRGIVCQPTCISPATKTMTGVVTCFYAGAQLASNAGTISNVYGYIYDGGSAATGTVTNAYGGYFQNPNHGTNRVAVWAQDLVVGGSYLAITPPTSGAIIQGITGIGTATPTALLDVAGFIRSTGTTATPSSGAGLEILYNSGVGYLQPYDRGAGAYKPLYIDSLVTVINPNTGGFVGIGTGASPRAKLEVVGDIWTDWSDRFIGTVYQTGTAYKIGIGTTTGVRALDLIAMSSDTSQIRFWTGATPSVNMYMDDVSNVVIGNQSALATNATNGFIYIRTCAGTPTGAPTAFTGHVAMLYDTTNNKIFVYNGAWKSILLV